MPTVNLKDVKAGFSGFVDQAIKGQFVTITRHGKPVAALVPLEAAELARKAMERKRPSFFNYLKSFPGEDSGRDETPSRDVRP
ncbi:type II toxin-antitoxin system prevent-host-death family antitoxin [Rhodoblastus sp.]|uniref:type II toxin-antitoxin system Phd/YefM family antitoxin n=1 Tax=Rhodoblastus sp. TaxID=1962975 RepID=UPI00262D86B4|nr:type II toxin-antitoxin system prevent-host-death family antitoxin [Rhodoblastus sp.]